jgi:hypothetical protein
MNERIQINGKIARTMVSSKQATSDSKTIPVPSGSEISKSKNYKTYPKRESTFSIIFRSTFIGLLLAHN